MISNILYHLLLLMVQTRQKYDLLLHKLGHYLGTSISCTKILYLNCLNQAWVVDSAWNSHGTCWNSVESSLFWPVFGELHTEWFLECFHEWVSRAIPGHLAIWNDNEHNLYIHIHIYIHINIHYVFDTRLSVRIHVMLMLHPPPWVWKHLYT